MDSSERQGTHPDEAEQEPSAKHDKLCTQAISSLGSLMISESKAPSRLGATPKGKKSMRYRGLRHLQMTIRRSCSGQN